MPVKDFTMHKSTRIRRNNRGENDNKILEDGNLNIKRELGEVPLDLPKSPKG